MDFRKSIWRLFRRRRSTTQTPQGGSHPSRKAPNQLRGAGSVSSLDSKHRGGTGMVDLAAELERVTREKLALEARVSELAMYQSEAAALRSEVHKLQEERLEMERLQDVAHSPLSDSEKEQLLARQHSNTVAELPDTSCSTPDWDKQSSSSLSEVSVACLQDRIMQMEETHYSTNEELQATLQELADLQVQLIELQADNERLTEEKSVLLESLCRQTEKLEDSRSKVDTLQELLLHRDQGDSCTEREQKLVDLLKGAQEEREALLLKQEELASQLNEVRQTADLQGQEAGRHADRVRLLESTVDATHAERKQLDQELALAKEESSSRSIEISRLTTLLDNARAKIEELEQAREAGDKTELDEMLDNARKEKDALESQVATLQEQLSRSQCEVTRLRDQLSHIQEECKVVRNNAKSAVSDLEYQCSVVRQEKQQLAADLQVLQESVSELQVQCQCHLEDKRQLKAVLSETQRHLGEVERRLAEQEQALAEEKKLRQEESSEWVQFQSDLLMTVRVANDFKTEAQQELEKFLMENKTLRDKLRSVEAQLEKLKAQNVDSRSSVALQRKRPLVSVRPTVFSNIKACMKKNKGTSELSSYSSDSNLLLMSRTKIYDNPKTKSESNSEVMLSSLPNLSNAVNDATESQKSQDELDEVAKTKKNSELYDIHWNFPALKKRSWSHIARFALDLPSHQEEERPLSSPAALPSQKHSVPVSPAVPVVPSETSTILDMAAVRRQHKVGVSRQDSRLSVKSLIESIENATKQAKAGPGSRSSSTSSLSSIASGAPPTPTSPRRRLASETPLRDQQQTTNTAANKLPPLRKNTLSDKPSSQDEEVSATNPVSIFTNKTMEFVRRNSYGDLSERKDPLSGLVKNGGSKRNALLKWCQNKTVGYRNIDITNFSSSWNDGLALCAILHSYLPERVPYDTLTQSEKRRNFTIAFSAAESVGIPTTLNVTDMIQLERPDWQQVMAYVTAIYKHFET